MRRALLAVSLLALPAAALAGYRASSYKVDTRKGDNYWNARAALDHNPATAWMIDPEHEAKGEWLEIDLPKSTVNGVRLISGFAESEERFRDHSRLKTVRVEVIDAEGGDHTVLDKTITLADVMTPQDFPLPATKVGGDFSGGKMKLTVVEIFEGQDYPALAVSEVRVGLAAEGAFTKLIAAPGAEAGHDGEALTDQNPKTFWVSNAPTAEFRLESPGFGVSGLTLTAGPNGYTRPKTLEITANEVPFQVVLENKPGAQTVELPGLQGFAGSMWGEIGVKILDAWEGGNGKIALSEVQLQSTNYDGI